MTIRKVKAALESASAKPITLGTGQLEMARKLAVKTGLVSGSVSHDMLQGAVATLLCDKKYAASGESPLKVKGLAEAVYKNRVLLNKVLGEIEEDYHASPSMLKKPVTSGTLANQIKDPKVKAFLGKKVSLEAVINMMESQRFADFYNEGGEFDGWISGDNKDSATVVKKLADLLKIK